MNLFKDFKTLIVELLNSLAADGLLPAKMDWTRMSVDPPRDAAHGDLACNAAMVFAKPAGMAPRRLAELLVPRIEAMDAVASASIAGPGFINITLKPEVWAQSLGRILTIGPDYGRGDIGQGISVNVEYVSANPTGPLTVGHARGAIVGDALAALLAHAGYSVTKEYYINDAGSQVDTLARSAHLRYREALGEEIGEIPSGCYPGDYLKAVGRALADRDGAKWRDCPEETWLAPVRRFAIDAMMKIVIADLAALGVRQDVFSSERALVEAGAVERALDTLEKRGLIYVGVLEPPKGKTPDDWEPRPQTLFKATAFGDDVDRPLRKSDGSWTYFAGDLAYHLDKYKRGAEIMIDVWGADHGGYVKRMSAAVAALTDRKADFDVKICQMVKLLRGGVPVKMSKRSGEFITLRDAVEEVGKDVLRFIMLTRKNDAPLEFDFEEVMAQSRDNPVFYVQYAHARIRSVFRHAAEDFPDLPLEPAALAKARLDILTDSAELGLMKLLVLWPRTVESAALAHEPHRIAFYLQDLAAAFHALWNLGKDNVKLRFLVSEDAELTQARLALLAATAQVIAAGLGIFGVEPVEEMT